MVFLLIMVMLIMTFKGIFKEGPNSEEGIDDYEASIKPETSRSRDLSRNRDKKLPNIFGQKDMGTISIDPGHGGVDGGTIDGEGLMEKDINLDISLDLKRQFESDGFDIVMTREVDKSLEDLSDVERSRYIRDIYARTDILTDSKPDVFASIHVNSNEDSSIRGIRVYYYPGSEDGRELAESICNSMNSNKFLNRSTVKATALPENYHLLREVEHTGVLVEVGFITNREDNKLLRDERYKKEIAYSIKDGMIEYLKQVKSAPNKNSNRYIN